MWQKATSFKSGDYTALTPFVNHTVIRFGVILNISIQKDGNCEALIKTGDGKTIIKRTQTPNDEWILTTGINI